MKKIAILGSTGSIGTQTLEIVEEKQDIEVLAIAAYASIDALENQVRKFHPQLVCVYQKEKAKELSIRIADTNTKVVFGMDGLIECVTLDSVDMVVTAVVGMIGIKPTMEAIKAGKDIALANKETLVTAGHLIMALAKENHVSIYPVDSEHSAIYQCLHQEEKTSLSKILLTASGGPFRGKTKEELKHVTVAQALKHPNWSMGKKITIDSSTLVNKGLEVIEAKWLFDVNVDQIQVVVQPKSVIHSMVEFTDGAVMAQLGTPDMKLPIQYALYEGKRRPLGGERLDFWNLKEITFEKPDMETFRGLRLAYEAGRMGGSMPTVFNAANEKAVAAFLQEKISYLEITDAIEYAMNQHQVKIHPSLEDILATEQWAYDILESRWNS